MAVLNSRESVLPFFLAKYWYWVYVGGMLQARWTNQDLIGGSESIWLRMMVVSKTHGSA